MEVGLSLGSNLGDRLAQMQSAKRMIISSGNVSFIAQSHVYETEPVGVPPIDRDMYFLNAALIVKTTLSMRELLKVFKRIERSLGRVPSLKPNTRRPIDIDIIYAGNLRVDDGDVVVPHPRWFKRRFVVQPMCDVRPELIVPGQTATVAQIYHNLGDKHRVLMHATDW